MINTTKPSSCLPTAARSACRRGPVPKDYAENTKRQAVDYGEHQVFTGPYMIQNDGKGKLTGYEPGKKLVLVRNPSWDKGTDFRLPTSTGSKCRAASTRLSRPAGL